MSTEALLPSLDKVWSLLLWGSHAPGLPSPCSHFRVSDTCSFACLWHADHAAHVQGRGLWSWKAKRGAQHPRGGCSAPTGGRKFRSLICIAIRRVRSSPEMCVMPLNQMRFPGGIGSIVVECLTTLKDLHMKRGHGGRLVDVTSLRVSVIDGHRRMEGREELRGICKEWQRERKKTF